MDTVRLFALWAGRIALTLFFMLFVMAGIFGVTELAISASGGEVGCG